MASDATQILREISEGDRSQVEKLMQLVYDDLRGLARAQLGEDTPNHTLDPTAVVHEVFIKLIDREEVDWRGWSHFFAVSAKTMRHILVDYAREKAAQKRGGNRQLIPLDADIALSPEREEDVSLDEAITALAEVDEQRAMYCNWLSEQDEIPENEWIYEPNDAGEYADGMRIRENYLELSGYRLPTDGEWEHACRSGTKSTYAFGEPTALLEKYGQIVRNSSGRSQPVGSLLPNDAGLFDMHGNVWEWPQGPLSPVRNARQRAMRGGSFVDQPERAHSVAGAGLRPQVLFLTVGFRPVRTYHPSAP